MKGFDMLLCLENAMPVWVIGVVTWSLEHVPMCQTCGNSVLCIHGAPSFQYPCSLIRMACEAPHSTNASVHSWWEGHNDFWVGSFCGVLLMKGLENMKIRRHWLDWGYHPQMPNMSGHLNLNMDSLHVCAKISSQMSVWKTTKLWQWV